MRVYGFGAALAAVVALAGCEPSVPDSGVGSPAYQQYIAQQRAAAAAAEAPKTVEQAATPEAETAQRAVAALRQTQPQGPQGERVIHVPTSAARTVAAQPAQTQKTKQVQAQEQLRTVEGTGGLSNEQDFAAVSGALSIADAKARREALKQQYQVVQPTALGQREKKVRDAPNIVEFALATNHPIGQKKYRRSRVLGQKSNAQACAKYGSPDVAQEAFLKAGGPVYDRQNLDPDGDGYACGWDPRPYRKAVGG
jgi:hypothetical protein